jgi:hypothetical protein
MGRLSATVLSPGICVGAECASRLVGELADEVNFFPRSRLGKIPPRPPFAKGGDGAICSSATVIVNMCGGIEGEGSARAVPGGQCHSPAISRACTKIAGA